MDMQNMYMYSNECDSFTIHMYLCYINRVIIQMYMNMCILYVYDCVQSPLNMFKSSIYVDSEPVKM